MYNEKIETLINAALADGVLTEKEKQILFKNAQEQGIDLDEFEMVLNAKLVELSKKEQKAAPKSDKFGDVRKCPTCGSMLQSFQTKCEECGYEFKNVESVQSASKLFDLLQAVELRKSQMLITNKGNASAIESQSNAEKANIIKNFPAPNSKEDLLELLSMATSNAYDNDGVIGKEEEVWIQKTDQIYKKIIVCSENDKKFLSQATSMIVSLMKRLPKEYKKFTTIPNEMRTTVEAELKAEEELLKQKKFAVIKKYGIYALVALALFFTGAFIPMGGFEGVTGILGIVGLIFIYRLFKKDYKKVSDNIL